MRSTRTVLLSGLLTVAFCGAPATDASAANDAVILESHLPSSLEPGEEFQAWVLVQNTGTTTWRNGGGYQFGLGALGDSDPFYTVSTRVLFDSSIRVRPQETHLFEFTLVGKAGCREVSMKTDWQMVQDLPLFQATRFGGIVVADVTVVDDCAYRCNAHVADGYGRPLSGIPVTLKTFYLSGGILADLDEAHGTTDANGNTPTLRISPGEPLPAAVRCEVAKADLPRAALDLVREVRNDEGVDPETTSFPLDLRPIVAPAHTARVSLPGLSPDPVNRSGEGRLYLSRDGLYDKVVVIPQGIDFAEQNPELRKTPDTFWLQFREFLVPLEANGYDVWLVKPWKTGENIHQQAAEFAQAIKHAATVYRGGPASKKVIVAGYSLGGIVSRLATARWEADATWRTLLQLPETLPVSLIAFGDAPLRGANAPIDLAHFLWDKDKAGDFNLNTCAAQQLLLFSCTGKNLADCGSTNNAKFFSSGQPVVFSRSPGAVCDSGGVTCQCDAGPAVYSVNVDGFADVPTVGFSAGTFNPDQNQCYGGDKDRNASMKDLCPNDSGGTGPWVPQPGQVFTELRSLDCPFADTLLSVRSPDLVAGSRFPHPFEGVSGHEEPPWYMDIWFKLLRGICEGDWRFTQYFAPTFIPTRSALAADHPDLVPFGPGNWRQGTYQASHDRPEPFLLQWLIERFELATRNQLPVARANIQPTALSREYRFDGSTSSDADGTIASYAWTFGDGSQLSGSVVTHRYASPGTYGVSLTVTDNQGGASGWTGSVVVPQDTLGNLDVADPLRVQGWTCNRNDFAAALTVQVYLDAPAGAPGSRLAGTAVANQAREPGVGTQCGGNVNHGFLFAFPTSVRDGQSHGVYVYGSYNGAATLLPGSPRTVTFPRPAGTLDVVDGIQALGWACDSDDYSVPLVVHFYMDGPAGGGGRYVGGTTATLTREPGVAAACGGNPNHGFQFAFPLDVRDGLSHPVYAYALDYFGVYNSLLAASPRTAVFPLPSYPLTVTKAGTGSGTLTATAVPQPAFICGSGCSSINASFVSGTTVRLAMTPDVGFTFTGWGGACQGTQSTCDVVVNGPKAVTATFEPPAFSVALQYFPLTTPCRILDTRTPPNTPFQNGVTRAVQITGACVPAAAQAVAAAVIAVAPSAAGHVRMNGNALTLAAVTAFPRAGDAWAGSAVSSLSSTGQANVVAALANGGSTHLIIDATGYFAAPGPGGQNFTPRDTTRRLVDTSLAASIVSTFASGAAGFAPAAPSALAVSVAAVAPPGAGYLALYPGSGGTGGTSTLNYSAGGLIYNGSIVRLGSPATADLAAVSVQGHRVIIDVNGVFHAPTPGSLQYHRIEPCRVLDTRVSGGKLAAGESRSFQVRRMCGAIPDAARAVAANFSAVEPVADGHLAFGPAGGPTPTGGHLLYQTNYQIGSGALLPLSASATLGVDLTVSTPTSTHAVVDITGYFSPTP